MVYQRVFHTGNFWMRWHQSISLVFARFCGIFMDFHTQKIQLTIFMRPLPTPILPLHTDIPHLVVPNHVRQLQIQEILVFQQTSVRRASINSSTFASFARWDAEERRCSVAGPIFSYTVCNFPVCAFTHVSDHKTPQQLHAVPKIQQQQLLRSFNVNPDLYFNFFLRQDFSVFVR